MYRRFELVAGQAVAVLERRDGSVAWGLARLRRLGLRAGCSHRIGLLNSDFSEQSLRSSILRDRQLHDHARNARRLVPDSVATLLPMSRSGARLNHSRVAAVSPASQPVLQAAWKL